VISKIRRISDLRAEQGSASPRLYLSYHINRLNLPSLRHLPELCKALRIDAVKLSWTLLPEMHRELSPFHEMPAAAAMIREVASVLRSNGIEVRDEVLFSSHMRGCWNLTDFAFIGANGMAAACCNRWVPIGDLTKNDFEDIWNGQPHRRILFGVLNRRPDLPCEACRQLQAVDYMIDPEAFLKSDRADRAILSEKLREMETLPSLCGLDKKFSAGFEALKHQNTDQALDIYSSLIRDYPHYYEIRNNLAAAYWLDGKHEKCMDVLAPVASIPHNQGIIRSNIAFLRAHGQGASLHP
jgi:hypothetical protein